MKKTLKSTLFILSLVLITILIPLFCCISTKPNNNTVSNPESENSATDEKAIVKPKPKDKIIIIHDEPTVAEVIPEVQLSVGEGGKENTGPPPAIPNQDTTVQNFDNNPIEIFDRAPVVQEPQVIIRPTPIPEPELPETENAGDVWTYPRTITVKSGTSFKTAIHLNTGIKRLAAYGIKIFFNKSIIDVEANKGNFSGVDRLLFG